MLAEAFVTQPAAFDQTWLRYEQPLDYNYQDGQYVLYEYDGYQEKIIEEDVDALQILKHTILFQIADLHRMQGDQLENEFRYLGLQSPTGNSWYNFDVFSYLSCAMHGMSDGSGDENVPFARCDWAELASILCLGRLYE